MRYLQSMLILAVTLPLVAGCGGKGPATKPAAGGNAGGANSGDSAEGAPKVTPVGGWEDRLDKLSGRIVPQGPEKIVRWLGWSNQGKSLVLVTEKQLESIQMPEEKHLATIKCELPSLERFGSAGNADFVVWANTLENSLDVLDAKTLQKKKSFPIEDSTDRSLACSPDGKLLALGQKDGSIALFETTNWQSAGKLEGHKSVVKHLTFSTGGLLASCASDEEAIRVWDVAKKATIHTLKTKKSGYYLNQAFLDEKRLASHDDDDVYIWDLEGKKIQHTIDVTILESRIDASPDGKWLAMVDHYGYLILINTETGKQQSRVQAQTGHTAGGSTKCPVAFSPDGKQIAVGGPDVRLYDVSKLVSKPEAYHLAGDEKVSLDHGSTPYGLAFAPKLPVLISGDFKGKVKLWSVPEFKETHTFDLQSELKSLAMSPDGLKAALLHGSGYLSICGLEKGAIEAEYTELELNTFSRARIAYVDDHQVVFTRDRDAVLYDLSQKKVTRVFAAPEKKMEYLALSPNHKWLATAALHKNIATIWNFEDGKELQSLDIVGDATDLTFSPDGRWLAICGRASSALRMYSTPDFKPAWETSYESGAGEANVVAFSPDSTVLAEGLGPNLVLRDAVTGKEFHRYFGHSANLATIAYSHDGALIATGAQDGTLKIWDAKKKP